jgi:hypothetical protein
MEEEPIESKKGKIKSLKTGRIFSTYSIPFTDKVTFGLKVKGGAIFEQGVVIGDNESTIPGTLRYRNNELQLRNDKEWVSLSS